MSHTIPQTPKTGMAIYTGAGQEDRLFNDKRACVYVPPNGGEEGHGLDWQDYGWRQYDPTIGRWTMVDPADEFC